MEPNYKMTARVLVVDDDAELRSLLKIVLETNGHEVCTAVSATEARHILPLESFDLVLTDMRMESEDSGYEVVRVAREQAYRPKTVILTAFPLLAQEWRKAGADAVLYKPTPTTEILRVLEQLMFVRTQGRDDHGSKHQARFLMQLARTTGSVTG
jgi:CheY-like chemotaxis protein